MWLPSRLARVWSADEVSEVESIQYYMYIKLYGICVHAHKSIVYDKLYVFVCMRALLKVVVYVYKYKYMHKYMGVLYVVK